MQTLDIIAIRILVIKNYIPVQAKRYKFKLNYHKETDNLGILQMINKSCNYVVS